MYVGVCSQVTIQFMTVMMHKGILLCDLSKNISDVCDIAVKWYTWNHYSNIWTIARGYGLMEILKIQKLPLNPI